uniref:Laminin EGF-like domain-containing protein n=1 Tax=Syphacia muris TaxID=451379 RepID=A0A0N5AHT3_9BILA
MYHNIIKYFLLLIELIYLTSSQPAEQIPSIDPNHHIQSNNPCYDEFKRPQRCVPDFINAAFNLDVEVTNTCGIESPTHFCVQSGHSGMKKVCDICDDRIQELRHPAKYLTDFNNANNETWWQSETMNEKVQYPNTVNLTLRLGKTFDITYVRLKFISPRPESFAIYKKVDSFGSWIPWQYYSGSCYTTYNVEEKVPILPGNEAVAQCTREFSDISPLTGGNIPFSTLEGRPSSRNFEESNVLQEWVTASEIRIVLTRMNTFGDEVFKDPKVLRSYYYAISDFAVGGRCKCNGHASECVKSTGNGKERLVCRCEHDTEGADCEKCKSFYNDRPWRPGTANDANECLPCNCNNLSTRCFFDPKLYNETGSGGHCTDCAGNTQGPHCEECVPNTWRRPNEHYCFPCNCNETGSVSSQCDAMGQCICKPGIGGQHCDQCKTGFYDFSATGCKDCQCQAVGSENNEPSCDANTGECRCKQNVEGRQCDLCKPGYFDLSLDNEFGCTPCFCYSHSSVCSTAEGYFAANISSEFQDGKDKWKAATVNRGLLDTQWSEIDKAVAASDVDGVPVYFIAPAQFCGDQRLSYNQDLWFTFRLQQNQNNRAQPSQRDIVIVGGNSDQELYISIDAQNNPVPSEREQSYRFRIHSNPIYRWSPCLSELDFIAVLANVTQLKIRATYNRGDLGFLSNVHLGSASLVEMGENSRKAKWVESCVCSESNVGQFCESCAPGYKRAQKFGGSFTRCVKCDCYNHSSSCDAESGACICEHNTSGENCKVCARGYYGDALQGTSNDCIKCPCPNNGSCKLIENNNVEQIMCTECPTGYMGLRCESCADGYFGSPGDDEPCVECQCNGNIDLNNVGNCDSLTGECKKCIYNTAGFNCEVCQKGFWGDALKGNCESCSCYVLGTKRDNADYTLLECRQSDGQCDCHSHVTGAQCDKCEEGYFNITSGNGCQSCDCDPVGSIGDSCDIETGQCECKEGVTGRRCNECAAVHYGFSEDGCKPCNCEPIGSESAQCDKTGQCLCHDFIEGRRCDKCMENRYNLKLGCLACDQCYTLIQTRISDHRIAIKDLEDTLNEIVANPALADDEIFNMKVNELENNSRQLSELLSNKFDGNEDQFVEQIGVLQHELEAETKSIQAIDSNIALTNKKLEQTNQMLARWNFINGICSFIFCMDRASDVLMRIYNEVKQDLINVFNYLEQEGQLNWNSANETAEKYGKKSRKLSEIAEEARSLAERHEERSVLIKELAQKAMNVSKQAVLEADDAVWGGKLVFYYYIIVLLLFMLLIPDASVSQQIASLLKTLNKTSRLLNETKKFAEAQLFEADKVYKIAGNSLTDVETLKTPEIDVENVSAEIKRLEDDMKTAAANIADLATANSEVYIQAQSVLEIAKAELVRVREQQQESDQMLADVDSALELATKALSDSDTILDEARNTLQTLQSKSQQYYFPLSTQFFFHLINFASEFHDRVENSKSIAIEQLNKLGIVREKVGEAVKTTQEAKSAIGDANADATSAVDFALESQQTATAVKEKVTELFSYAAETLNAAKTLRNEAEAFSKDVERTSASSDAYVEQAEKDGKRATNAASRAAKAKIAIGNTQKEINDTTNKIQQIIQTLKSLDVSSENELDKLEKILNNAEEESRQSELDVQIEELTDEKKQRERTAQELVGQLNELENEVQNLEAILAALPNKCFNQIPIESEGQK